MAVRRAALVGVLVIGPLVVAACGGVPSRDSASTSRAPAPPASSSLRVAAAASPDASPAPIGEPCHTSSLPPVATRLATAASYLDIHLTPVPPDVQPAITAGDAFDRMGYPFRPAAWNCGFTEFLAYWSADTPATMPPHCVPAATTNAPWSAPGDCATLTPRYQHVLAWVFTWHEDCLPSGGAPLAPGQTRPPQPTYAPLSCRAITFVDATTGQAGFMAEGGL